MIYRPIFVVTTDTGDHELAFTERQAAWDYLVWVESVSPDDALIQVREIYLKENS